MVTTIVYAERLFGSFKIAIGNIIAKADRSEIYGVSIVYFTNALGV